MSEIKPNTIEFHEDDVDHQWDTPIFDEGTKLWCVNGLQGWTMTAWVKANTAEEAGEKAQELYDENA